jgi:hypothetical protein
MLVLVLCVVGIVSPVFFGGRMSRLASVRFRGWWILVAALLSQILIIEIFPEADRVLLEAIHMATYVAAAVFVGINWRVPGLLIIAAGGALNGVTIALNGGQLPASREALKMAGIEVAKSDFVNSGVVKDPVLPLFGDIFVWPQPFPFANVFSFGDALIVIGTFYAAHRIAGSRLVKRPWRSPQEAAEMAAAAADRAAHTPLHAPTQAPLGVAKARRRRTVLATPTVAGAGSLVVSQAVAPAVSPAASPVGSAGPRHAAAARPAADGV